MKHLYLLLAGLFTACLVSAQFSGNLSYGLSAPLGDMADNIKPAHGIKLNVETRLPGGLNRVSAGVDLGLATYAHLRKEQTFAFADNTGARAMVNYSSNIFTAGFTSRIHLLNRGKLIPYITGRAGYALFFSTLTVEDPLDTDGCAPLDKESLLKDGTIYTGYGAGIKIASNLLIKCAKPDREWFDISVVRTQGGKVDYINTRRLKDHYHDAQPANDGKSRPLTQRFINVNSNIIHEHQVAEVYTSALRLLEFRIGYTVRF
jgi:hypothetical protein